MESAQDFLGSLRREIALDVGDHKDQHTQQHHDFNHIVEEKLNTPADPAGGIKPNGFHKAAKQTIQPLHSQYLILNKRPHGYHPFIFLYRNISMCCALRKP